MSDILHAPVSLILLVITSAASAYGLGNQNFISAMMLDVSKIRRHGQVYRFLTAGFIHGGPFHLLINMVTLYSFGPPLEIGIGTSRFLILYFGSLLGGSALSVLENWRKPDYLALGASGAIAGLSVCFSVFAPLATIYVFMVLPMWAIVYSIAFIGFSWYASNHLEGVRIAGVNLGHSGHLGGALAGLAITCILFPANVRALPGALAEGFQNLPSLF